MAKLDDDYLDRHLNEGSVENQEAIMNRIADGLDRTATRLDELLVAIRMGVCALGKGKFEGQNIPSEWGMKPGTDAAGKRTIIDGVTMTKGGGNTVFLDVHGLVPQGSRLDGVTINPELTEAGYSVRRTPDGGLEYWSTENHWKEIDVPGDAVLNGADEGGKS